MHDDSPSPASNSSVFAALAAYFMQQATGRSQLEPLQVDVAKIQAELTAFNYDYGAFTFDHFVQHLRNYTGSPIVLQAFSAMPALLGACIHYDGTFYLVYNSNRHLIMQAHTLVHEAAHILLKHRLNAFSLRDRGHLNVRVRFSAPHSLLRDLNDVLQEAEADCFARLFMMQVGQRLRHDELYRTRNITLFPPFDQREASDDRP